MEKTNGPYSPVIEIETSVDGQNFIVGPGLSGSFCPWLSFSCSKLVIKLTMTKIPLKRRHFALNLLTT